MGFWKEIPSDAYDCKEPYAMKVARTVLKERCEVATPPSTLTNRTESELKQIRHTAVRGDDMSK